MKPRNLLDAVWVEENRVIARADHRFHSRFLRENLFVEYDAQTQLEDTPPSVLSIPFLLNVLPLVWVSGHVYRIHEIDARLAEAQEPLRETYRRLYPSVEWKGKLVADRLRSNPSPDSSRGVALLFSGGVDSVAASLGLREVPQLLITLLAPWTADPAALQLLHAQIREHTARFAQTFGHEYTSIRTNMFQFISPSKLLSVWPRPLRWMIEVQYGIGFSGLTAPLLRTRGIGTLMLAGCELDFYGLPNGSHPDILSALRWSDVRVDEVGLDMRRQSKLELIYSACAQHGLSSIALKPCQQPLPRFENCCRCDKCLQTILGLWGISADPRAYGFDIGPADALATLRANLTAGRIEYHNLGELLEWLDIQAAIRHRPPLPPADRDPHLDEELGWFLHTDLAREYIRYHEVLRRSRRAIRTRCALALRSWPWLHARVRNLTRRFA